MSLKLARRARRTGASNRWSLAVGRARARVDVLDLMVTQPSRAGLTSLDALPLRRGTYRPAPLGSDAARQAVATWYAGQGLSISPLHIAIAASTSELYGYLLRILCNPGDSIWVPSPGYPLFEELARWCDVVPRHYALFAEDNWRIDVDSIDLDSHPGPIVAVSPANPTGSMLHREEWRLLRRHAAAHSVALIVDEVFAPYPIAPLDDVVVPMSEPGATLCFFLGGLSKARCAPGLKLGWMAAVGPPAARDAALEALAFVADTFLSVGGPIQEALPDILADDGPQRAAHARVRANARTAAKLLGTRPPEGGWYQPIHMPSLGFDWAERALDAGVIAHPGWFYDLADGWLVTSLLTPPGIYAEGLERLRDLSPC